MKTNRFQFLLLSLSILALINATTREFRGVNWADERDNYNSGWIIPSGLSSSDDYLTIQMKAENVLSEFEDKLGANTVRLPINPPSVFDSWWSVYSATIDTAISKQMKVVLGCWESDTTKDGKIDNLDDFWRMWGLVTKKYVSSDVVYFEIFNEPFGYSPSEWTDLASQFLTKFPTIPQGRVIVSGTGYNDHLSAVGEDSRLKNCLLSLHIYAFWNTNYLTEQEWRQDFQSRVGRYFPRAIVSEYGVPMNSGLNFTGSINNDNSIAFMYGVPDQIRDYSMGSIYWPGWRDGDSYSLMERTTTGNGGNITLAVTNPSGLERIQIGWGL
jgi:endoglucanase